MVEQLPSLHAEVDRALDESEHQFNGEALILAAGAGDEAGACVVDRLEDERLRGAMARAGIAAEDEARSGSIA